MTYGEFSQNSTTPYPPFPGNVSSLKLQVQGVNSQTNTVNASFVYNYKNGTQSTQPLSGNTETGQGNLFPYLLAGNLSAGDLLVKSIYPYYPYVSNETVERVYAGALRSVNLLNLTYAVPGEYVRVVFYWDAQTGLVLDGAEYANSSGQTSSNLALHFKATETNVWVSNTSPDYSFDASSLSSDVLHAGEVTSFRLDLANLNGFTGDINLDTSLPMSNTTQPPGLTLNPSSITLSTIAPTASALLTVSTNSNTTLGQYLISVNGTSGSINHQARLLVVVAPPDFIINADPGNLTIFQGTSKNSTITVTGRGGFTGPVILQAQTQPFGTLVTATLSRTVVILNTTMTSATSTLSVDTTNSSPGTTSVYISATSGTIYRSLNVFVNVTGPDFHITASPAFLNIRQGQTGQSTIILTSVLGFAGTVNLSTSVYGSVSAVLSNSNISLSSGGQANSTLTVTVPSTTPPGLASIYVNGVGDNGLSHSAYVQLNVTGPDFTLSSSSFFISLNAGQSANSTLTLSSRGGFAGTIILTTTTLSSVQSTVNPFSVTLNATQTSATALLTVTAPFGTPPSTFVEVEVTGTSGNIVHNLFIEISITGPDFSVSTDPGFLSIPQGSTGTTKVSLSSIDNFSGNVTLSASPFYPGSLYLTATLGNSQVKLTAGGSANTTLTIQTATFTPPGSYYVQITATSGALTHYSQVYVSVIGPDFSLSASPSYLVMPQGTSTNTTIAMTSIDNLNGSATLFVAFSSPIIVSPNTYTLALAANSTSTATFKLSVPANTIPGYYYVHMTGDLGSVTHDVYIQIQVTGPDFTIFTTPPSLTLQRGSTATSTIIVNSLKGFNGTVSLTLFSYGLTVSPTNAAVTLTPGGTASVTVTIQVPTSTPPGSYFVSVNANSNVSSSIIAHYAQIYVQVTGPDFTIQSNPYFLIIEAGQSGQSTIQLTSLDGFSGNITLTTNYFIVVGGSNFTQSPVNVTLNPRTVTLASGTTSSSTLDISSTLAAAGQNFTIFITATGNNETHYTQVYVSIVGPTFRLSADHTFLVIPDGGSATATITTASVDGFSGTVQLSVATFSTFHVSIAPQNITLGPGGSINSTLTITVPTGTASNWYYSLVVTGSSNGTSRSVFMTVLVVAPSFSMSVNPIFTSLAAGATGKATLILIGSNGFSDTIRLSSSSSPSGLSAVITPTIVTLNSTTTTATAAITITVPANASSGFYNVNIDASTNTQFENITIVVQVMGPDFSLSANPSTFQITPGGSASSTITISGVNGFNGTVHLFGIASEGPGVDVLFSPVNVTLTPSHPNGISTLTITVAPGAYAGPYVITIIGSLVTSSNTTILVHYATVAVTVPEVPNFQMLVSTGLLSIDEGSSGKLFLTLTSLNGFSGNVTITAQITAQGLTVSPTQTTVTLTMNSTVQTSLTISVGTNTPPAIYSLALNATSNGITHPNGIEIAVLPRPPDFALLARPSYVTLLQDGSTSTSLIVSGINEFSGLVNFTAYSPGFAPGLGESFTPLNVTLSPSNPNATLTMTISASQDTPPGPYNVTVVGISYAGGGFTVHTVMVEVTVLAKPDFTVAISPIFMDVVQATTGSFTISMTSNYHFSGNVSLTALLTPSGPTASFSDSTVFIGDGSVAVSALTVAAGSSPVGYYNVTIEAVAGSLSHQVVVNIYIAPKPDFSLATSSTGLIIVSGASAISTVSISPINGFVAPVTLSATGPAGFTTSYSVNPISGGSGTSTLTVAVAGSVSAGSYILTVTGSSGSITHSATLNVTVAASAKTTLVVTQVSWTHRLSLSKNSPTQTFTLNVKNTGISPAYVQLLAAGNSTDLKSFFNVESGVALLSPGASITITLSQPFNGTIIGLKFNFTIQLFYGTSIDPAGNILSPHTLQAVKGSFTIVK